MSKNSSPETLFDISFSSRITGRIYNNNIEMEEEPKEEVMKEQENKKEQSMNKEQPTNKELLDFLNYLITLLPKYPKNTPSSTEIAKEMSKRAGADFESFFSLLQMFMIDPSKNEDKLPKEQIDLFNENMSNLAQNGEIASMKVWPDDLHNLLTLISGAAAFLHHTLEPKPMPPLASSTETLVSPPPADTLPPPPFIETKEERKTRIKEKIKRKMPTPEQLEEMREAELPDIAAADMEESDME
jgi:hypothetical protein